MKKKLKNSLEKQSVKTPQNNSSPQRAARNFPKQILPAKALRFSPIGPLLEKGAVVNDCDAAQKVWTKEGNIFTAHPVMTGLSDGINTEITGGIEKGTEVVTEASLTGNPKSGAKKSASFMPGPPR